MAARVSVQDFETDPHGKRYVDVLNDPIDGPALRAALSVMNHAVAVQRMVDAVDRYQLAPLAGTVREIEAESEFISACRGRRPAALRRLKQAVGVACKLVMATEGYVPQDHKDGKPDQGRLESYSKWFRTARKYKKAR